MAKQYGIENPPNAGGGCLLTEPQFGIKAKDLFNKRDYKNSMSLLTEIIETEDKNSEDFFLMGNIFHMNN